MTQPGWTATLAEWAAALRLEDVPPEVVHQARRVLLDHLAAVCVGATTAPSRAVRDYLEDLGSSGPATVVGAYRRASAPDAALANGTAAHAVDVDDGYTPGGFHPGAPALPAILATAETKAASPNDVLRAVVVGYELSCRLAGAGHPATWRRGFHNTPLAGVFGAAAGVAVLLGADAAAMSGALGLAGSHASGLFEFLTDGSDVKRLHAGKAARDGVVSAELAVRGLPGPRTVLEGPHGYAAAYATDEFDEDHLVGELGTVWRMQRTYLKPYPCCRHVHGPIDAVLALQREHGIDPDSVEAIEVDTYTSAARHGLRDHETLLAAQMSMPYGVAVALVHGEVGLVQFEEAARRDPRVGRLVDLVEVRATGECDRAFPRARPAIVRVRVQDAELRWRVEQPLGEPDNPLSDTDLEDKVRRLCSPVIGADRCKQLIDAVWEFDGVDAPFAVLREDDGR